MKYLKLALGMVLGLVLGTGAAAEPTTLPLAADGEALHAVVVGTEAADGTREAASDLADYLGRISGASFEVREGDGATGLTVGVAKDFPGLALDVSFDAQDPFRRDEYLLRAHAEGVYLIGATELATHLAVWDFLHRLGYRLYFPTDTWEIVPSQTDLRIAVDTFEQPDYITRRGPRGAPWSNTALWNRWRLRNRVESSFGLNTGHVYGRIMHHEAEAFDANPKYYALVDGERKHVGASTKFCISNPGLRQLVVDWARRQLRNNPDQDSISMDPSDGGSWCECEECAALGSVTDQAIILANQAAEAINAMDMGPKFVGIYAYNQHSPPPGIEVHPHVIVSIATSFIRGGYTVEELAEGWRQHAALLGVREYHDVTVWSHNQPRQARGGDLDYLARTIPYFHAQNACFMNSSSGDAWGANGLGFWITPRLLWDIDQAERIDELVEDFVNNAFGSAREPMHAFYHLLNLDHDTVRSGEDMVARMYRHLDQARQLTDDPAVHNRLDDLILYTRYVELYQVYRTTSDGERQRRFEKVLRHIYRIHDRMMVATVAVWDRNAFRDSSVEVPAEAAWHVPEEENPWKSGEPFTAAEIARILEAGVANNEPTVLDFEPVAYSEELVPATELNLPSVPRARHDGRFRGRQRFYAYLSESRREIELQVTGGMIARYRDRGNVNIMLHADQEATLEPVAIDNSVPPDGEQRTVLLRTPYSGLHTLEWNDGNDMTRVLWSDDLPFTVRSTLEEPMRHFGRWSLYFYVPRGTEVVGGYATGTSGRLLDGQGTLVFSFDDLQEAGYFSVPVPEGQDGTLWKFDRSQGQRMLMTVPPYLAPSAEDLLLPREVVEVDSGQ